MKNILILFLITFSLSVAAQVQTSSPTGKRVSNPTQVTISTTTETTLIADSVYANNLLLGKYYPFRIDLSVTTGLLNLSTLTVRLKFGSQVLTIINAVTLASSLTGAPISIMGYLVSKGTAIQFVPVMINQSNTSLFNLISSNSTVRGSMSVDATVTQPFSITVQLGGTLGSTVLIKDWSAVFDF